MEDVYDFTAEELKNLGDAVVWTAILAAIHQDGVIHESEKAEAIKQAHIRSWHSDEYIRPIYSHLDANFAELFDQYSSLLTGDNEADEQMIKEKIEAALEILKDMGQFFTDRFSKSLKDFYVKVFRADASVLQYFAFPLISAHIQKGNFPSDKG